MTKFKVLELKNFVEFNVPFMFETPAAIEKKVDLNKIISNLSSGVDDISVNINFPIIITKQTGQSSLKLVVKVRKFRHKVTGNVIVRPEIIGVVKERYGFEALADFHFESKIPSDCLLPFLKNYHSSKGDNPRDNFVNQLPYRTLSYSILPTAFSKNQNNFILTNKLLQEDFETLNTNKEKKEIKLSFQARFMHFFDMDIPQPDSAPENMKEKPEFLFLKEKFEERPIWLKNSLMFACKDKIKFESYHMFRKMLSYLAYSFKDGPWKHAYVRFGYDPRAETSAYYYQVIDIGVLDNAILHENIGQSHKRTEFETYDPTFSEAPNRLRQLFQLSDMPDTQIQEILSKEGAILEKSDEVECGKKYGWLSPKGFKAILKYMKSKFQLR